MKINKKIVKLKKYKMNLLQRMKTKKNLLKTLMNFKKSLQYTSQAQNYAKFIM